MPTRIGMRAWAAAGVAARATPIKVRVLFINGRNRPAAP
jgi:hypothetical protein